MLTARVAGLLAIAHAGARAQAAMASRAAEAASGQAGGPAAPPPATEFTTAAFTLADALARARADHPALRAAAGRRQAAVGQARQDAAFLNPVVEWRRENLGAPVARDEFLTATLGADAYGRRYALRGALGAAAARAAADSAVAGRAVAFDVARAYWRTALAAALRDVADLQRRAVDSLALVELRRAREGAVPEGSALRTRLEADRARLAAASARADAERARGELARALALPLAEVPWPTDPLDPAVAPPRVAEGAAPGEPGAVRPEPALRPVALTPPAAPDVPALIAQALGGRPELVAARARVDEAERRARAERLGALPGVGAVGGSKHTGGFSTGVVGVFVSVPLFDRNGGARARTQGDLVAAQNDLRAQEAQVAAEVEAAARAYAALVAEGAPGGGAGAAALDARGREVTAVAAVAYREGAATLLELLDAVRSRGDVRAAALRWAADLRLARLDLDRAVGAAVNSTP